MTDKNKWTISFVIVVAFVCALASRVQAQAEAQIVRPTSPSPHAQAIEQILALPETDLDLATALFAISKMGYTDLFQTNVDMRPTELKIEQAVTELARQVGEEKDPVKILKKISLFVFKHQKFSYQNKRLQKKVIPEYYLLNTVIEQRAGNSLGLSMYYMILAERLGLPLYSVNVPGAFFVRYQNSDGVFNVDLTEKGKTRESNAFYLSSGAFAVDHVYWLKRLDKKETTAIFLSQLGQTYNERNMLDQAFYVLELAKSLLPNSPTIHGQLGVLYRKKGWHEKSIASFKALFDVNRTYIAEGHDFSRIDMDQEMRAESIAKYEAMLEINPADADAHYELGFLYSLEEEGNKKAISEFKAALKLNPHYPRANYYLGEIYSSSGNKKGATSAFEKVRRSDPLYASARFNLGVIYMYAAEMDKAIAEYNETLDADSKYLDAYYNLAYVYSTKQMYDKEIEQYKKGIAVSDKRVTFHNNLASAYFDKKMLEDAETEYKIAISIDPDYVRSYDGLGLVYKAQGRTQEAISQFKKALEVDPDFSVARSHLKQLSHAA